MTSRNRVWVIDDDRSIRWVLERAMTQAGISISAFASADYDRQEEGGQYT